MVFSLHKTFDIEILALGEWVSLGRYGDCVEFKNMASAWPAQRNLCEPFISGLEMMFSG